MLLVADIGNTNLTFGVFDGSKLVHTFRAETSRSRTADEYAVVLTQMLALKGFTAEQIDAVAVASVVPPLTDVLVIAMRAIVACKPVIVGPGTKTGIRVLYDDPRDVGADRIVNAVAAHERASGAAIVVDFGTGTTFDCISPNGEYLGGVIVPGISVSLDALLERAARLRPIEIAAPGVVVGRNPTQSLQSGVVHGYSSMVDGLVAKLKNELGFPCRVFATGGLAPLITRFTTSVDEVDLDLTLVGLRIIHERNGQR